MVASYRPIFGGRIQVGVNGRKIGEVGSLEEAREMVTTYDSAAWRDPDDPPDWFLVLFFLTLAVSFGSIARGVYLWLH